MCEKHPGTECTCAAEFELYRCLKPYEFEAQDVGWRLVIKMSAEELIRAVSGADLFRKDRNPDMPEEPE